MVWGGEGRSFGPCDHTKPSVYSISSTSLPELLRPPPQDPGGQVVAASLF